MTHERSYDYDDRVVPEVTVSLTLTQCGLPLSDVTSWVGVEPDSNWTQPSKLVKGGVPRRAWGVGKDDLECWDIDEAVQAFFEERGALATKLSEYPRAADASLHLDCLIDNWGNMPILQLSADSVQRIAAIGCEFGIRIATFERPGSSDPDTPSGPSPTP